MAEFTECWFKERSCRTLANLVRSVESVPGRIVEIGSWEGRSTLAIAAVTERQIHAVDTWRGSPSDISGELAQQRNVFEQFAANVADHPNIHAFVVDDWRDYVDDWRDNHKFDDTPVALVFIDAEHTYEEVSAQIAAFLPLMASGGIMCGDDALYSPVNRAVAEAFDTFSIDGVVWWTRIGGR